MFGMFKKGSDAESDGYDSDQLDVKLLMLKWGCRGAPQQ